MIYSVFLTTWWWLTLAITVYPPDVIDASEGVYCEESELVNAFWQPLNESFNCWWETNFERDGSPGMAVAILKDGELVFKRTYGKKQISSASKVDGHTAFRMASVSKTFAGILTAILVERGFLNWDDKVVKYVPGFKLKDSTTTNTLEVKHLLSHTTGLPRHAYSNLLNAGIPYREILSMLSEVTIFHPPGDTYNYQNVAFSVIGDVLHSVTGKAYSELLEEYVFLPLGMVDASTDYETFISSNNIAHPHQRRYGSFRERKISPNYFDVGPAAGVNASLDDMIKYLRLLTGYHPEVLTKSSLQNIYSPQVPVSKREGVVVSWRPVNAAWYGLGWRGIQKEGQTIIYHGGYVNGYRSEIMTIPEENLGMVVLSNAPNSLISDAGVVFLQHLKDYGYPFEGIEKDSH